ncbi:MAG TPA: glycoside hydrolase family 16 protein [Polyangia bacterium]|nr:glycoside hydrolase family 16 protein [Polyangia bacterium]
MDYRSRFLWLGACVALAVSPLVACSSSGSKPPPGTGGQTGSGGTTGTGGASSAGGSTGAGGDTSATGGTTAPGTGGSSAGGSTGSGGATGGGGSTGDPMDAGADGDAGAVVTDGGNPLANWVLTWSDEFNGAAGTKPDSKYWGYDLGGGGWGVSQLQVYTNAAANASMDGNGNLAVVAIKDAQGNFTSARLKTQGKFEQAYGRFEIRTKIATGNGMWPAFWMLGNNFGPTPWPDCGEIDIMEVKGQLPYTNLGSLHGPGYSGMHPLTGHTSLPDGGPSLSDDFHTYAIEWETDVVRFYLDDVLYETQTPANIPTDAGAGAHWVYDHPFFILLNLAVGGRFPGSPDGTTFPQTMLVDYIRVYSRPK